MHLHTTQRNRRRKKKSKVNVVAPQVQQAYGGEPPTVAASLEGSYLTVLGVAFLIIMLEGVFIAVSVSGMATSSLINVPRMLMAEVDRF